MLAHSLLSSLVLGLLSCSLTSVTALPLKHKRQNGFVFADYSQFQISGGVAGKAQEEAAAIFITPFEGVDLATVSADVLVQIKTMREQAEDAETELFNPQIDAATGDAADALQRGKIKNKVLKLTAILQALKIEAAQGTDNAAKITAETTKLNNNIKTDQGDAGLASTAATGTVPVRSGRPVADAAAAPAADPVEDTTDAVDTTDPVAEADPAPADTPAAAPVTAAPGNIDFSDYSTFQISDGVGGNAEAEANAVFVDQFAGVDLSTVSSDTLAQLSTARSLAEKAETSLFNPAIDAASGAEADALQVGKIKNKVLKLTGLSQILKIKIARGQAAGSDTSSDEAKLVEEQTKLSKNIATDVASAGQPSKAAPGTV